MQNFNIEVVYCIKLIINQRSYSSPIILQIHPWYFQWMPKSCNYFFLLNFWNEMSYLFYTFKTIPSNCSCQLIIFNQIFKLSKYMLYKSNYWRILWNIHICEVATFHEKLSLLVPMKATIIKYNHYIPIIPEVVESFSSF